MKSSRTLSSTPPRPQPATGYRRLLPYLKPHWGTIAQALLRTFVFTAVWPLLAWLAGKILAMNFLTLPPLENSFALFGGGYAGYCYRDDR